MTTPAVQQGTEITYRLRWHHLPVAWTSRIEVWKPPDCFVDVQLHGPFRLWRHRHEFTPENHGTRIRDIVHYRAPCAWLQRTLLRSWVDKDLEQIFMHRQQIIAHLFGGGPS
jgi:ligand-binding SRPBCC domain-containing protein